MNAAYELVFEEAAAPTVRFDQFMHASGLRAVRRGNAAPPLTARMMAALTIAVEKPVCCTPISVSSSPVTMLDVLPRRWTGGMGCTAVSTSAAMVMVATTDADPDTRSTMNGPGVLSV